jgi:ElaB/YqjD/DUF883 family membrane-anchored ribosome-binding protein
MPFADVKARAHESEEAMATMTESAAQAVREYAEPLRGAIDEKVRDVRRAVVAGRHAVEDCAAGTTVQVRRHPFASLGIAAGIGVLVGCVLGFTAGRVGRRPSDG